MRTCIACANQITLDDIDEEHADDGGTVGTPTTRHAIKTLTSQFKVMAIKASGAYRNCKSCPGSSSASVSQRLRYVDSDAAASGSEGFDFHQTYRRAGETLSSGSTTPMALCSGKDEKIMMVMESRFGRGGLSSEQGTPSMSEMTDCGGSGGGGGGVVFLEEEEPKEWVAQVEPGVLITLLALPEGGNDLKRIRFSRELFNKWQAQRWWSENYDKVMELYNIQRFNQQVVQLPNQPRSEDEVESAEEGPVPHNLHQLMNGNGLGYSSSDSMEHLSHNSHHHQHHHLQSVGLASTPKLSGTSFAKTETSSMDASVRTASSSHEDQSGELSISNASDEESEWVEQDQPGVYITVRALPGGVRELRRVRFSRERFGETHARLWWEENRARIHEQYL